MASRKLMSEIETVLPSDGGIAPIEVHRRLGWKGSRISIRHALRQLRSEGRAEALGEPERYRYIRTPGNVAEVQ